MPGIAHLLFGLMLVVPIILIAKDRFHYKVAAIFVLNNWNGPDSYWPYSYIPFPVDTLLGYMIWAIPLALFFSYFSRFSIAKTDRFVKFVDDGKRDITWLNAYILCLAGGICHFLIDGLFHGGPPYNFSLWEGVSFSLGDVNSWGTFSYGLSEALIVVGFVAMIITSLLIIYYLKKEIKHILLFLGITIGLVFLSLYSLGWEVFGEREISVLIFMGFFIFLPLIMLGFVADDVYKKPTKLSPPLINKALALKIVALITFVIAFIFVLFGLSGIIAPDIPREIIGGGLSDEILIVLGIIVMIISGLGVFGAIGLFFRNNLCRYLVIFVSILLWFFVYPIAIALFLCRNDVKEMFIEDPKRSKININN
ncbi:MAG TPA: hypothetical protein VMV49_02210 [Candidatus Deferrimicrobium sp.]|nr:hypothetical protein [Candidatus Deferrimicrobium sp.]